MPGIEAVFGPNIELIIKKITLLLNEAIVHCQQHVECKDLDQNLT